MKRLTRNELWLNIACCVRYIINVCSCVYRSYIEDNYFIQLIRFFIEQSEFQFDRRCYDFTWDFTWNRIFYKEERNIKSKFSNMKKVQTNNGSIFPYFFFFIYVFFYSFICFFTLFSCDSIERVMMRKNIEVSFYFRLCRAFIFII